MQTKPDEKSDGVQVEKRARLWLLQTGSGLAALFTDASVTLNAPRSAGLCLSAQR